MRQGPDMQELPAAAEPIQRIRRGKARGGAMRLIRLYKAHKHVLGEKGGAKALPIFILCHVGHHTSTYCAM